MKESELKHNRECAEYLGWEDVSPVALEGPEFIIPLECLELLRLMPTYKERTTTETYAMHFHDSYDWAMLLVKECDSKGLLPDYISHIGGYLDAYSPEDGWRLKRLQISQAALAVLKENSK